MLKRIDISLPTDQAEDLAGYLFTRARHGWEEDERPDGSTLVRVHFENATLAEEVVADVAARWPEATVTAEEVENKNWAAAWRDFFTPVLVGETFEILPPWLAEYADPDKATIIIDPGMAFGTGHHPTTAMCLRVAARLIEDGRLRPGLRFLDLGTGSGVLGIGCALKGLAGVGLDIDPQAVDCAEENIEFNRVEGRFSVAVGSIEAAGTERFDLVMANILAEPLMELADEIIVRVAPGGCLILSGILAIQADRVAEAYMARGLPRPERLDDGEWSALWWTELP